MCTYLFTASEIAAGGLNRDAPERPISVRKCAKEGREEQHRKGREVNQHLTGLATLHMGMGTWGSKGKEGTPVHNKRAKSPKDEAKHAIL